MIFFGRCWRIVIYGLFFPHCFSLLVRLGNKPCKKCIITGLLQIYDFFPDTLQLKHISFLMYTIVKTYEAGHFWLYNLFTFDLVTLSQYHKPCCLACRCNLCSASLRFVALFRFIYPVEMDPKNWSFAKLISWLILNYKAGRN